MFGGCDVEMELELMREEEREEGIRQGVKENQISAVRSLMNNMKMSAKKAMDVLDIPQEDREGIRSQL